MNIVEICRGIKEWVWGRTPAFRGQFPALTDVPTIANRYLPDRANQKTPIAGDYLNVVEIYPTEIQWESGETYTVGSICYDYDEFPAVFVCIKAAVEETTHPEQDEEHWKLWFYCDNEIYSKITGSWMFLYEGTWEIDGIYGWHPRYKLDDVPLTPAQTAALNSGITSAKVEKLDNLPEGSAIPFESGTGTNSAQQKGTGVKAIGQSSIAAGTGESSKSSYTVSGAANATTYTTSAAHGLSVGDVVNFHSVYARIIAVNNTTSFTVDTTLDSSVGLGGAKINIIKGVALGSKSATFGDKSTAIGDASFAEGLNTKATNDGEHAEGKYNISIQNVTQHTVGIGTSSTRKNAHTITRDGKHYIPGIGTYQGTETTLPSGQDLATIVNNKQDKHIQSDPAEFTFIEEGKWYDALEGDATQICAPEGAINTTISCFIFNPSSSVETLECYKESGDFGSDITTIYIQPGAYIKLTATVNSSRQATWTVANSVMSSAVSNIVSMSQTDYDNLQNKDASTLYIIV